MKVKFHDNKGSESTFLFNPSIEFFRDGSIIILETTAYSNGVKYELPMFAGDSERVWVDLKECGYSNAISPVNPGSFKAVWKTGNTVNICRYKEKIDETFIGMLKRKFREIT